MKQVRFFGLIALLPILLGLAALGYQYLNQPLAQNEVAQFKRARTLIEADFAAMHAQMRTQALDVMQNEFIRRCLMQVTGERLEYLAPAQKEVIAYFNTLKGFDKDAEAVELYDAEFHLLGWHGITIDLSEEQRRKAFPSQPTLQWLSDSSDGLQALEWWQPVFQGTTVIGAVRVVRLIHVPASAQRSALPDFQLKRYWEDLTGLFIAIQRKDDSQNEEKETAKTPFSDVENLRRFPLKNAQGDVLSEVSMTRLSDTELSDLRKTQAQHIFYFSICLFFGWLLFGIYQLEQFVFAIWQHHAKGTWYFWGVFLLWSGVWALMRYTFLEWEIPRVWFLHSEITDTLFDPKLFASDLGGGLMRSIGDFTSTAFFFLLFSWRFWGYAQQWISREERSFSAWWQKTQGQTTHKFSSENRTISSRMTSIGGVLCTAAMLLLCWFGLEKWVVALIQDSKLDYLAWTGIRPPLALSVVYGSLLLSVIAWIFLGGVIVGVMLKHFSTVEKKEVLLWALALVLLLFDIVFSWWIVPDGMQIWHSILYHLLVLCWVLYMAFTTDGIFRLFTLRGLLIALAMATLLLYAMIFKMSQNKLNTQMETVVATSVQRYEEVLQETLDQSLADLRMSEVVYEAPNGIVLDSTQAQNITDRLHQDLNEANIGHFEINLAIMLPSEEVAFFRKGTSIASNRSAMLQTLSNDLKQRVQFDSSTINEADRNTVFPAENERFTVIGSPVRAWALLRASLNTEHGASENNLSTTGVTTLQMDQWQRKLSISEFRNGVLLRGEGTNLDQLRLPDYVNQALDEKPSFWEEETIHERSYNTLYQRHKERNTSDESEEVVFAIRVPAPIVYDHLYYLLRIIISGIWIVLPCYLWGLWARYKANLLPPKRIEFRDKVLNAFFTVGMVAVIFMAFFGQDVVNRDNQAIQRQLERRLQRVEDGLTNAIPQTNAVARKNVLPADALTDILERQQLDSLSNALSLDLNVYANANLWATTRPELVRERLVGTRLPIEGYSQLYVEGFRTAFVNSQNAQGVNFTIGYLSLNDDRGFPQYVISLLSVSEQEYLQEERARTIAYLFGALLILLVLVMVTATLVANTLSRPISRLRDGMQAAAAGQFDERLPVESKDEVGELVQTFNEMQTQLAESRQKLGIQERQMAWNEMARQVAHEIKNPLTPMKLSVQHLKRAYQSLDPNDAEAQERFNALFQRVTSTLTEQTDALTRIANEFSNFARMPQRKLETLNIHDILQETVELFRDETHIQLDTAFYPEPLWIRADREEVRRIFINLAKNSIQAMPEGGILSLKSEKLHTEHTDMVQVIVSDTGKGIAEDIQEKIFQPNFSTKTSGMGLGLAIVKKSIEEMRGKIWFETKVHEGTTFFVQLPLNV